jgi:hypothetical protein
MITSTHNVGSDYSPVHRVTPSMKARWVILPLGYFKPSHGFSKLCNQLYVRNVCPHSYRLLHSVTLISHWTLFCTYQPRNLKVSQLLGAFDRLFIRQNCSLLEILSFHRQTYFDCCPHTRYKSLIFFPVAQQPLVGQGLLNIEASQSQSDTPQSVGLLWTNDQPEAKTSTSQNATVTRHIRPCPRGDSNPQSQQARRHRATP